MTDVKKEPWLNYLALSTVILAVCATLSTFKGSSYSTRAVMSQTQAANKWSHYQSKSIKGYLYETGMEKLELEIKAIAPGNEALINEYKKSIEAYSQKLKKYDEEKSLIQQEAKDLEKVRDDAKEHSGIFGMAVIFLQIAILLSSVAALLKKKPVWYLGLSAGIVGIVYFANGFLLFF
jgi:malonyl CoA-acyl carrier protein transacylase